MKKVTMLITTIITALISSGCAQVGLPSGQEIYYANEEAAAGMSGYVDYFLQNFNEERCSQSFKIKMMFYDQLDQGLLGVCQKRVLRLKNQIRIEGVVMINSQWWGKLPSNSRMTLIAHELGHCVLDAKHDESDPIMPTYHNTLDWSSPKTVSALKNLIIKHCH